MPMYAYRNTRTGETVELFRHVAERHNVPKHLKLVIVRGHGGVACGRLDPTSAEASIPRSLRQLEEKMPVAEIERQSGFSINHLKRVWGM